MARLTNSPAESSVLEVEARKSFAFSVVVQSPNGGTVDLTGSSVTFTVGVDDVPVETAAIIDMPLSGTAVVPLQADDLDLDAGSYPFTVTLRTGGYSLVIVKGELKVLDNPEHASTSQTYGGATPSTGLMATLVGLQVIKVTVWSGVPQGVGGGLDATGVTDGYLPTAQGDGTWAWQPPATVDWSDVTGTDAVVLRPELDAYAPLAGAAFTGSISAPDISTPSLEAGDAEVGLELRVGPASSQLSMAYGTISATEAGVPVDVSFPSGITDLPVPVDPGDATSKEYVDDLVGTVAAGISSGNRLAGLAQNVTNSGYVTSATAVNVLTHTMNVIAGQRYRVSFTGMTDGTVASDIVTLELWAGASIKLQQWSGQANSGGASTSQGFYVEGYWVATVTGSVQFRATLARAIGTVNVRILASSTYPMILAIEQQDETIADIPWTTFTAFNADWSTLVASGYPPFRYRIVNGWLELNGPVTTAIARTGGNSYPICTLPVGSRPQYHQQFPLHIGMSGNGISTGMFLATMGFVQNTGVVSLYPANTTVSFASGSYVFFNVRIPMN